MFGLRTSNLTRNIVVAMIFGVVVGLLLANLEADNWLKSFLLGGVLHVGGTIFIKSLKMLVVPLVFVSLVCGVTSLSDIRQLGRVGGKTLLLYLLTTAMAVSLALVLGALFKPGSDIELETKAAFEASEAPSLAQTIIDIFPDNPVQSMAEGNMLQVIVFAILFGIAINLTVGGRSKSLVAAFNDLDRVIMTMITILMAFAPIGVFCLIAKIFSELGFSAILPLAKYFMLVLLGLALHGLVVYPAILKFFSGLNPITFFRKFKEVWFYAFSTASSNATIPVTLRVVEKNLGVHNSVAAFSIPLGATVNMDGTAIMQGVATAFIAQAYGIEIGIQGYLMVVVTATLASIGTAGVPGVGLITLAMVLKQVGLPVEGIGLIMGIDRLLDMVRTAINVTGDAVVSCVVAKGENELDLDVYNS